MKLEDHPSVIKLKKLKKREKPKKISTSLLKNLLKDAGAHDFGIVNIDSIANTQEKEDILKAFPKTKTLISFLVKLNKNNIRSMDRSLADLEYTRAYKKLTDIAFYLSEKLDNINIGSITPSPAFPQKMENWPGKMHTISHKLIAAESGLGKIGFNRLILHPKFGAYICLETIAIDTKADRYDSPLDYNPCINCGICRLVCPTGAISKDGGFNFLKCLIHVYRDRIGGFTNWVEDMVSSDNIDDYKRKRGDGETLSIWQSLTTGGGYRCSYCMAVCPAGTDNLDFFIENKKEFLASILIPLKNKKENVYILNDEDSITRMKKNFGNKTPKII